LEGNQGGVKMGGCVHESIKPDILKYVVIFDHRCKDGAKAIIHLEAFLARVMALIKRSQLSKK
jgi:replication factor C subunit 3/5